MRNYPPHTCSFIIKANSKQWRRKLKVDADTCAILFWDKKKIFRLQQSAALCASFKACFLLTPSVDSQDSFHWFNIGDAHSDDKIGLLCPFKHRRAVLLEEVLLEGMLIKISILPIQPIHLYFEHLSLHSEKHFGQ